MDFVDAFITPKPRALSLYMEYCDLGSFGGLVNRYVLDKREAMRRFSTATAVCFRHGRLEDDATSAQSGVTG